MNKTFDLFPATIAVMPKITCPDCGHCLMSCDSNMTLAADNASRYACNVCEKTWLVSWELVTDARAAHYAKHSRITNADIDGTSLESRISRERERNLFSRHQEAMKNADLEEKYIHEMNRKLSRKKRARRNFPPR